MKPEDLEITHEYRFFRVYKNGHVEKFHWPPKRIPPSDDPITGVKSKDVIISGDPHISARIFMPRSPDPTRKLPVLVYFHGGGFSFDSAFSPHYHRHVSALCSGAHAVAVSVEYRLAPEHPIPACYDDSWAALQWIAAHGNRAGPDPWLNEHADFDRVFLIGDSGGGNISHNLGVRFGSNRIPGINISGLVLVHPVFGGHESDDRMWMYLCPSNTGRSDPRLDPPVEDMARIGCVRVLVCVAERDDHSGAGKRYYEKLKWSGWGGTVGLVESEGEDHCFHLWNAKCERAVDLVGRIVCFIKQGCSLSAL